MGIVSSKTRILPQEQETAQPPQKQESVQCEEEGADSQAEDSSHVPRCSLMEEDGLFDDFEPLSWSTEPPHTLNTSDWTIVIRNGEKETLYYVHRVILAQGERSCSYFARLFQSDFAETKECISRIDLEEDSERVFPVMLDFVYQGKLKVVLGEQIFPLRMLARYFGCRALMEATNGFLQKDLACDTAVEYLQDASKYNEEHIFHMALSVCAEHFHMLSICQLSELPLDLFRTIVTCPDRDHENEFGLYEACTVITYYMTQHAGELTANDFLELTSTSNMPVIDSGDADDIVKLAQAMAPKAANDDERDQLREVCRRCWHADPIDSEDALWYVGDRLNESNWWEDLSVAKDLVKMGDLVERMQDRLDEASRAEEQMKIELGELREAKRRLETENEDLRRTRARLMLGSRSSDGDY